MTDTALAIIEEKNVAQYFVDRGLDPILEKIRAEATCFVSDISTKAGRDDIRSRAAKLARTKVALDEMGKKLTEDQKRQIKAVDVERARAWDALEALQKEVRAPLTEWEDKEKARVAAHEAALAAIPEHPAYGHHETAEEIAERLVRLENLPPRDWQEFTDRAAKVLVDEIARTRQLLEAAREREAEAAELARLRAEETERRRREHEERLKAEAAEEARRQAEARARAEAEAEAARVRAEQMRAEEERRRIERDKEQADRLAVEAEARAQRAEEDRLAAVAQAEVDRMAAAVQAKRDADLAAQRERDKIEAERKAEADALAAREADKRHRGKINRNVLNAIQKAGIAAGDISEASAKAIVEAIVKGAIPHVKLHY